MVEMGEEVYSDIQEKDRVNEMSEETSDYETMADQMIEGKISPEEFVDYYNEIIDVEAERAMILDPLCTKREFT